MVSMSNTRGTQTDLVTDRNIADCLAELRSKAEFQDLTYRLSRSCTGEMTLTVTRNSLIGLLGAPFDPMSVTVTADAMCYFSVLFTPVEVISLKGAADGDLNLQPFRKILWKLTGRAGYGFCPGFKDSDFPPGFQFEVHGLQVLGQPFRRIQSPRCAVLVPQRRASARAVSQPLQLKLCSSCFETLTHILVTFKSSGRDLSVPAFAKFLPYYSLSPRSSARPPLQDSSKDRTAGERDSARLLLGEDAMVTKQEDEGGHRGGIGGLGEAVEEEVEDKARNKAHLVKPGSSRLTMRNCSVLLDRVLPGSTSHSLTDSQGNAPTFSHSSPTPLVDSGSITALSAHEALPSSSTTIRPGGGGPSRLGIAAGGESATTRPVLSARIKPFRKVMPHESPVSMESGDLDPTRGGQDAVVAAETVMEGVSSDLSVSCTMSTEGCPTDAMESAPPPDTSRQGDKEEGSPDMGPPVLTPEGGLSPGSPQPLLIDEDTGPERQDSGDDEDTAEPESKRQCLGCPQCGDIFVTEGQLHHHLSQHHPTPASANPLPVQGSTDMRGPSEEAESSSSLRSCPICHTAFSNKKDLEKHLVSRHGARLHPCRYCGQKFALKKNLADHLQRHRGAGVLTCKECGQSFNRKKLFAAHVREHMGSFPYFCTICSRMFSREKAYEDHLARHRAGRGVHAILEGSQRTRHSITSKAKKCLEEKALFSPTVDHPPSPVSPRPSVSSTPQPPLSAQTQPPPAPPSPSHSASLACPSATVPDSLVSTSSNLLLLSEISVARAQYDRQLSQETPLTHLQTGKQRVSTPALHSAQLPSDPTASSAASSASSSISAGSVVANQSGARGDSTQTQPSQSQLHLAPQNDPVFSIASVSDPSLEPCPPKPPDVQQIVTTVIRTAERPSLPVEPGQEEAGKTHSSHMTDRAARPSSTSSHEESHKNENEETQLLANTSPLTEHKAGSTPLTDAKCTAGSTPLTDAEQAEVTSSHPMTDLTKSEEKSEEREKGVPGNPGEEQLSEREEKLRQKEEELKERERAITRKNMMLFQQLLLAQISQQQPKTSHSPMQSRAEKTSPQQALAMFSALNAMASRAAGGASFKPLGAGSARTPAPLGKTVPSAVPNTGTTPVEERGMTGSGQGEGPVASIPAVLTSMSAARTGGGHPPLPITVSAATSGGETRNPSQSSLPTSATLSFKHPPTVGATVPQVSAAPSVPASMTSKWKQSQGPCLSQSPFFLKELMKLESKMPASAKAFLPPAPPHPTPAASIHRTRLISSDHGTSPAVREGGLGLRTGLGPSGGEGSSRLQEEGGGKGRGKRGAWSGGLVKEKLSSVPSVVPLHEMQRLMSLTQAHSPLSRTHRSPSLSPQTRGSTPIPSPTVSASASPAVPPSIPCPATSSSTGTSSPATSASASPSTQLTGSKLSPALPGVRSPTRPLNPPARSYIPPTPATKKSAAAADAVLPSMPPLIPASIVEHPTASSWSAVPEPSPTKAKGLSEEVEPMDLTKSNSGRKKRRSDGSMTRNDLRPVTRNSKMMTASQNGSSTVTHTTTTSTPQRVSVPQTVTQVVSSQDSTKGEREDQGVQATAVSTPGSVVNQQGGSGVQTAGRTGQDPSRNSHGTKARKSSEAWPPLPQEVKLLQPGMALLQHLMPALVAQQAAKPREGSGNRLPAHPFPPTALLRMMTPMGSLSSMQAAGGAGRGMLPTTLPQHLVLSAQPLVRSGPGPALSAPLTGVTSAAKAVGVTLIPTCASPVSSPAADGITSSTATTSPRTSPSTASCLSVPQSPKPSVSSVTEAGLPAQHVATEIETQAHGVKQTSDRHNMKQGEQGTKPESRSGAAKTDSQSGSPLGGFAWHRPAPACPDPSLPVPVNVASPQKSSNSSGKETEKEKRKEAADKDLMADHNLWQQQFLATLREKRRQKQEQQQRQQQQVLQPSALSAVRPTSTQQVQQSAVNASAAVSQSSAQVRQPAVNAPAAVSPSSAQVQQPAPSTPVAVSPASAQVRQQAQNTPVAVSPTSAQVRQPAAKTPFAVSPTSTQQVQPAAVRAPPAVSPTSTQQVRPAAVRVSPAVSPTSPQQVRQAKETAPVAVSSKSIKKMQQPAAPSLQQPESVSTAWIQPRGRRKRSDMGTRAVAMETEGRRDQHPMERGEGSTNAQPPPPPSASQSVQSPTNPSFASETPQTSGSSKSRAPGPQTQRRRSSGDRRGQSRGRGRSRRRAPRSAAQLPDSSSPAEREAGAGPEWPAGEGAELQGFGNDGYIKVEPLEAGVRCDDCGHVFFNETDILEHDCEGP